MLPNNSVLDWEEQITLDVLDGVCVAIGYEPSSLNLTLEELRKEKINFICKIANEWRIA